MTYIDEEIAKIMKRERLKEQERLLTEQEDILDEAIDEEELIEGINQGKCIVFDKEISFGHYLVCDKRIEIDLPSNDIEIKTNQEGIFQSLNMDMGFGCNIVLTNDKSDFKSLSHYKDMMVKNMKKLTFKWNEEGSLLISGGLMLKYLDFINITGLGVVHNSMWFVMTPYGQAQININYDQELNKHFKHIVRAMMKTLKVN